MIPKIIHYVWIGGSPLPSLAKKCLETWKTFCPDYEIKKWDETNFNISSNQYCREAYEAKKFAFVSDYIRLYALVSYGGVYLDTDVELLKPIDNFLVHQAFSGFENDKAIPTGIMACERGFPLFHNLLSEYENRCFTSFNGEYNLTTNVSYITNYCLKHGLVLNGSLQTVDGFTLYPKDVFCPRNFIDGKYDITKNTVAVHHFAGSWKQEDKHKSTHERWDFYEKYGNDEYLVDMYKRLKDYEKRTVDNIHLKKLYKAVINRTINKIFKRK